MPHHILVRITHSYFLLLLLNEDIASTLVRINDGINISKEHLILVYLYLYLFSEKGEVEVPVLVCALASTAKNNSRNLTYI